MVPGAVDDGTARGPTRHHACRPHFAHLLLQAFRLHLSRQASGRVGLLYAVADWHLGKAIEALHADPARRWTFAAQARKAGLSRSIFTHR